MKHHVYGMNDFITLTEEDYKDAREFVNKQQVNHPYIDNTELKSILLQGPLKCKKDEKDEKDEKYCERQAKKEPVKNTFYNVYYRSENPPNVYKLCGDFSTFDQRDIEFNNSLAPKMADDFQNQKLMYAIKLSQKDIQKNPFIRKEIVLEKVVECQETQEVPKPPPKWKKFVDSDNDVYYYNVITKECQWEKPENFE